MFNLFKKVHKDESLEEQKADLSKYPTQTFQECVEGLGCDEIPGAIGVFGNVPVNPIPVNGPIGEIKYLSRLRVKHGPGFIFHRIGSVRISDTTNPIDVFEIVSIDGHVWDILYLDMYHPRRSVKAPKGYEFALFHEIYSKLSIGYGLTDRDILFPFNIPKIIEKRYDLLGTGIMGKKLAEQLQEILGDGQKFKRPKDHEEKLREVVASLSPTSYFEMNVSFP